MIKKIIKVSTIFSLLVCLHSTANASVGNKVDSWFDNMNYSNVTAPGVYEGQSARYLSLGGVYTRAPITQPFKFFNIQTPKFSAGCGGIDFYAGGFSAIDSKQLIENLRTIGQNAASLAFMLAIQIVSPQLSSTMEQIQSWANYFNQLNMDSCEAAQALVGGALDLFGADQGNCTVKRINDYGEDWTTANHNCTTGGKKQQTQTSDANVVEFTKGNLTWVILMDDLFFKNDQEFAELILNLVGTVIITSTNNSDDSSKDIRNIVPAITDSGETERWKNIYTALMWGKSAVDKLKLYRCKGNDNGASRTSPEGCDVMSIDLEDVSVNWDGMNQKVEKIFKSILSKIKSDQELTNEEKGLIASSKLPVYRFLTSISVAYPKSIDLQTTYQPYVEIIAQDIVINALSTTISNVKQRAAMMKKGVSDATKVKEFRAQLDTVQKGITEIQKELKNQAESVMEMQKRILEYEKQVMPKLSQGIVATTMWKS